MFLLSGAKDTVLKFSTKKQNYYCLRCDLRQYPIYITESYCEDYSYKQGEVNVRAAVCQIVLALNKPQSCCHMPLTELEKITSETSNHHSRSSFKAIWWKFDSTWSCQRHRRLKKNFTIKCLTAFCWLSRVREEEYLDKEPARNGESRRPDGQEDQEGYDDSSVTGPADRPDRYEERSERGYDSRRDYDDRRSDYDDPRSDYDDRRSDYTDRDRRERYSDRNDRYDDDRDYDDRRYDDRRDRDYDDDRYDERYDDRDRDRRPAMKPPRRDYDDWCFNPNQPPSSVFCLISSDLPDLTLFWHYWLVYPRIIMLTILKLGLFEEGQGNQKTQTKSIWSFLDRERESGWGQQSGTQV